MNKLRGTIKTWNDDKGFGFIKPESRHNDVFLHINNYTKEHERPVKGLVVHYLMGADKSGRECALKVVPEQGHEKVEERVTLPYKTLAVILIFFALVGGFVYKQLIPVQILYSYAIMSVVTFIKYAFDKSAAQKRRWRTPETTLHLFALFGGWPGAGLAQQILRHKSKKRSFRIVYYFSVLTNWAMLYFIVYPDQLRSFLLIIQGLQEW